jgi:predicted Zn-ribbon and HTH transcriptional regulator
MRNQDLNMSKDASQRPCYACGYDLQGNTTGRCPECGRSAPVMVGIEDPADFHHARAALEVEGLVIRAIQPGGSLGTLGITYGGPRTGWLCIDQNSLERVEEILDELGITANINTSRPIVDRSEPNCPKCNAELDLYGRAQCPECGTLFDWVEIDVPQIDPTHLFCRECGYELTGLTGERCPECNSEIADVDRVVAVATHDDSERKEFRTHRTTPWGWLLCISLAVMAVCGIVAIELSLNQDTSDQAITLGVVAGGAFCAAMACCVLLIATKTNRKESSSSKTGTIH